jgi:hypothetical protein
LEVEARCFGTPAQGLPDFLKQNNLPTDELPSERELADIAKEEAAAAVPRSSKAYPSYLRIN